MYLKVARTITLPVALFMCLQILGTSAAALPATSHHKLSLKAKEQTSSISATFVFEKAEEETGAGEGVNRMTDVVLLDFSRVAFSLSFFHTLPVRLPVLSMQYDVRPRVHAHNSVFLI